MWKVSGIKSDFTAGRYFFGRWTWKNAKKHIFFVKQNEEKAEWIKDQWGLQSIIISFFTGVYRVVLFTGLSVDQPLVIVCQGRRAEDTWRRRDLNKIRVRSRWCDQRQASRLCFESRSPSRHPRTRTLRQTPRRSAAWRGDWTARSARSTP